VLTARPIAEEKVPTYQYVCTDCASELEAVQSFSDPSLTECPTCGGKLRKRFGAVGVVFKGSGFYRNDSRESRPGGATKSESSDKPASSDSASKTETKSEPAAKSSDSSSTPSSSSSGSGSGSSGSGSGSSGSSGGSSSGSSSSGAKTSSAA
jgi:putative FmdB family regulatory protein